MGAFIFGMPFRLTPRIYQLPSCGPSPCKRSSLPRVQAAAGCGRTFCFPSGHSVNVRQKRRPSCRKQDVRMQFGNPFEGMKNPFADKRDGATTVSLTISFQCADRGPNSILAALEDLVAGADMSTSRGF